MKQFDLKKVLAWLGFLLRCPICGYKYNLANTKVVESEQNEALGEAHLVIHSDCQKCKSSVMFNVDIHGPEVYSAAMVTDLTGSDSTRLSNQAPLSADDVLAVHTTLKHFDGDFVKAFRPS